MPCARLTWCTAFGDGALQLMVIRRLASPSTGLADLTAPEYSLPSLVAVVPACCQRLSGLRQHHTSNYTKEEPGDTQDIETVRYSFIGAGCCCLANRSGVEFGPPPDPEECRKTNVPPFVLASPRRPMKKSVGNRRHDRKITASKSSAMHRHLRSSYGR